LSSNHAEDAAGISAFTRVLNGQLSPEQKERFLDSYGPLLFADRVLSPGKITPFEIAEICCTIPHSQFIQK